VILPATYRSGHTTCRRASIAGRANPAPKDEARNGAVGLARATRQFRDGNRHIDPALDYTKDVPAALNGSFDIVFDIVGSLTPKQGDALAKRDGIVIDTVPTAYKCLRSLYSKRHASVLGGPSSEILQKIVDLTSAGKIPVLVGRTAPLDESIALIRELEAGRRAKGKAVIVMQ
jgi:NADPH:quinone reductase-like Zn-dependent oxidoreductase